jgi:hypothetical protein
VTNERATTRAISWPTVIALVIVVAGVFALSLWLREHERRAVMCGPHSSAAAGDDERHCD